MRKSSAPGSEAARDKWFVQQKVQTSRKSSAPGSEAARDKWLVQQKSDSWEKNLPWTSGSVSRKRTTAAAKGAERLLGVWGAEPPGKQEERGAQPPPPPPPNPIARLRRIDTWASVGSIWLLMSSRSGLYACTKKQIRIKVKVLGWTPSPRHKP